MIAHRWFGCTILVVMLGRCIAPALADERVVTIGDSWAYLVADCGSVQLMLDTFFPGQGYTVVNESFGGGTAAWMATMLSDITTKLNAHPTADIIWLSASGNDLLVGQVGGGWYLGMPGESGFFDAVGGHVNTVVQHILNHRPDLQVVIVSYDYLNLWETGDAGLILAANLNIGSFLQNGALNAAFRDHETRKQTIANDSRRVHHVWCYGLVNSTVGYSGAFGSLPGQGYYPPDLYPDWPTRPDYMGADDPIHMNASGYNLLALHAYNTFFNTAFQAAVLLVNMPTIDFGNVRVGTSANGSVTVSNSGPNFTKVKNLTWPVAGGDFGGGGGTANPLFKDPTLGSDSAGKTYTWSPSGRGPDSQGLTITSDSGNQDLTLLGMGVGPVFDSSPSSLDFGDVGAGDSRSLALDISNTTSDPDLDHLTDLTLASAVISGPDAGLFQLDAFTPGAVLGKAQAAHLSVRFDASGSPGAKSATLTFHTDQGAPYGGSGQNVAVPLAGTVVQLYDLVLSINDEDWGNVALDPPPDNANAPQYPVGTLVALAAEPADGRSFKHWKIYDPNYPGDANYVGRDTNELILLVMNEAWQLDAVFRCSDTADVLLAALVVLAPVCILGARRLSARR
jgi:lysophospholipase L1-like esterase